MKRCVWFGLCLAWTMSAGAQIAGRELPQAGAALLSQDRHAPSAAWLAFGQERGWRAVDWDRFHAYPHRAFGPALPLPGGPLRDAGDLDARLRAFLADHPGLLSGGEAAGDKLVAHHLARHGGWWYAAYHQTWRGRRVEQSELVFRVSPEGRLALAGSDLHPAVTAAEPCLDREEAARRAAALSTGLPVRAVEVEADWVVLPLLSGKGFAYHSAWPCRVVLAHPEEIHRVFIDGATGEVLWAWNEVRHVTLSGQLRGLVEEQQPADPDLPHPLPHLHLTVDGQEFTTDATGHFSVEAAGNGPWTIAGECLGLFANVDRQDGADAAFTLLMTSPTQDLTVGLDQAEVVELDAYHHTTRVHDFITDMDPSFTWLDEPLTVRVNIDQTCNAYWDGSSINFFREGNGCPNTGRVAGVVYHEYGHGINDRQYRQAGEPWGMTNGAMHEGLADVTAIYLQDEHYVSPGWFIRELDNTRHYPEDIIGQVHYDGEILGGAMYDLRQALGLDLVRPMHHFARWGTPDDPDLGRASFEYFLELLLLDDDDGDLSNLTPRFGLINDAFNAHGIGTELAWMGTDFALDEPPYIHPPLEDLPVRAVLSAPGFVVPEAVQVVCWSAGTPETTVDLAQQPDGSWAGVLPGQPWNTVLLYYARVVNAAGIDIVSPAGAPEQVFRTRFVWTAGLAVDFEDQPGGEALNEVWQWGTPQDGPGAAYEGERCWGTNLTGNYPDMTVARMVLDEQVVSDEDQVIVGFHHWMAVEEGWDGVNVEMSLNDGDWTLITPLSGYDFTTPDNNALPFVPALTGYTEGWETLSFDLTEATHPGDRLRLRLNLLTDTYVTEAGWYVDLVECLGFVSPAVIVHQALRDSEDGSQETFPVEASVTAASALTRFDLIWRVDGGEPQVLPMQAEDDSHVAVIPGPFWEQTVEYRLEAEGEGGFVAFLPENPATWFAFRVGVDQTPPVVAFLRAPRNAVGWSARWNVLVEARDNLALPLAGVRLEWRTVPGDWQQLADLAPGADDAWSAMVDFFAGEDPGALEFRAVARDASAQQWESATAAAAVTLGEEQVLDDFEDPLLPGWQIEGVFTAQEIRVHGGSWALGTGEDGFYDPLSSGRATLVEGIDLRHVEDPALVLWETWFLENGDDEAWIEVSGDGGEDWDPLATRTNGRVWGETRLSLLPYVGVPDLRLRFGFQADGDNNGLHVGYFADDLKVVNASGLSVFPAATVPASFSLGEPWPNPFNPLCRVDLTVSTPEPLRLSLHNLLGQEVARLHDGPLTPGGHRFTVDGQGLASGLYLLAARQGGVQECRRLVLMK